MTMTKQAFRVLLVDDDPALLETMKAVLDDVFDVAVCRSAGEAIELLACESFHVICSDWQMPGMNGIDFFRQLSRRAGLVSSGCILVTAHADSLLEQVAWPDRKMLGVLRKPFRPTDLIERVTHFAGVAEMKRSTRELRTTLRRGVV